MHTQRALDIEPDRYDTLYNLANLIKDDSCVKMLIMYRLSLQLNPSSDSTWHNLGSNGIQLIAI